VLLYSHSFLGGLFLALTATTKENGESNSQYAYRALRGSIMNYALHPGVALNEAAISEALGVSRTPVREAFIKLKEERLIDIFPHKLSRVSLIDLALVEEGYFIRSALEPAVLLTLCGRLPEEYIGRLGENLAFQKSVAYATKDVNRFWLLDNEFHSLLYQAANRFTVWRMLTTMSAHYERVRYFDSLFGGDRLASLHDDHDRIFSAILKGDQKNLAAISKGHISGHWDILPRVMEKYPEYFKQPETQAAQALPAEVPERLRAEAPGPA
jgi:DNA-binding GntR family transcriptional regulator